MRFPIIYSASASTFDNLGLAVLTDVYSVSVTNEINGEYSLTFSYPINGHGFEYLQRERIIKADVTPSKSDLFYINKITSQTKSVIVQCFHISYQLSSVTVSPFTASSCLGALQTIPSKCVNDCDFTFTTNKTVSKEFKLKYPKTVRALLGGEDGSILSEFGGEYEWNGFTVTLKSRLGFDNGYKIRYGVNLVDFKQEENIANTATGILPYFYDEEDSILVCPSDPVLAESSLANTRIIPVDFTSEFKVTENEDGTKSYPSTSDLISKAQLYITENKVGVPSVSITVTFEDLSKYGSFTTVPSLGDTVDVFFEKLDIHASARIVKTVYDPLIGEYTKLNIGSVSSDLSNTLIKIENGVNSTISKVVHTEQTARQRAVNDLLKKMNAAGGLYLYDAGTGGAHDWYLHNKEALADSEVQIHINEAGIVFTSDKGATWNGISWEGDAILNKIYAVGIDGQYITANSISAETIKVGDFTNYATVNERDSSTMIPSNGTVYGGTLVGTDNSVRYIYNPSDIHRSNIPLAPVRKHSFSQGDVLCFEFDAYLAEFAEVGAYMIFVSNGVATSAGFGKYQAESEGWHHLVLYAEIDLTYVNGDSYFPMISFSNQPVKHWIKNVTITRSAGIIKVGSGYISADGSFELGPMSSVNDDEDVLFNKAVFVKYGIEVFPDNDAGTPYIDFHYGVTYDNYTPETDYTSRISETSRGNLSFICNSISFGGKTMTKEDFQRLMALIGK